MSLAHARSRIHTVIMYCIYDVFFRPVHSSAYSASFASCAGIMQTYIRVGLALPDAMMASLVCERNAYMRVWLLCVCGLDVWHFSLLHTLQTIVPYHTIRRRRPVRFLSVVQQQRDQYVYVHGYNCTSTVCPCAFE